MLLRAIGQCAVRPLSSLSLQAAIFRLSTLHRRSLLSTRNFQLASLCSTRAKVETMSRVADTIAVHPSAYPEVFRDVNIVEELHGIKVADPYRALEDPDAEVTKNFVDELNAISKPFLEGSEVRAKLTEKYVFFNNEAKLYIFRLTKLWDYEKFGCTSKHGDYYYHYHNTGLQNQWVYYRQKELSGEPVVFLDPNTFSEDGTTSIGVQSWSHDGSIFAYGICEKGSDCTTIKFRDATGKDLLDVIPGVRFSGIDWLSDNSGIFYSKYPDVKESDMQGRCTAKLQYHSLYFHKMGTCSTEDVLVAQFRENENYMVSGDISEDGHFLFVHVNNGCSPENKLYYYDLHSINNKITGKLELKSLFTKNDASYEPVDVSDDHSSVIIRTNNNSPMFKLVRVKLNGGDWDSPDKWQTLIAEDPRRKLSWASAVANDKLIVSYIEDVKMTLYVYDLNTGAQLYQLPLDIGSVSGAFIRKQKSEFFISFDSFLIPTIVYRGDFSTVSDSQPVQLKEIRRVKIDGLDPQWFKLEQVFYPGKDGTKIPMYIITLKDMKLDGTNAMHLAGYGGFNISYLPDFSISRLCLIRYLGVGYAVANLRGGGEYGESWHRAGMLANKQNVFDDFIAASEYLIANKYTNPSRLAIHGGSNGGLLVAACSAQRPDLFGAVLNRVGVLDMLRFHKFTIGSAWISEYGDPEKKEDFDVIYKYSPLHNLRLEKGQQFPTTLLMTADHDDRVVPSHTLKYIAQLYHMLKTEVDWQRNPIMARIEVKAGHGAGKPTSKVIAEIVDMYCFLQRVLNLKWRE